MTLGKHVLINTGCTIGHDAKICDFVTIYPNVSISGNTEIGERSELGTGMKIIQEKKIGDNSIIGAGAVVVIDIPANCTSVGCPDKTINYST